MTRREQWLLWLLAIILLAADFWDHIGSKW
jgi:hypothetical protein